MQRSKLWMSLATLATGFLLMVAPAYAQATPTPGPTSNLVVIGALFIVGTLLLLAEIFLIPGFGVAGVLGLMAIGGSCWQSIMLYGWGKGSFISLGLIALTTAIGGVSLKILFVSKAGKHFVQKAVVTGKATEEVVLDPDLWIGRKGKAQTALRPAGKAKFDEEIIDVAAEEALISAGADIEIVRIDGNRPVVRTVKS